MKWSDLPIHPTPKALRQFAAAWLVVFLALGAHQYFARGHEKLGLALGAMAVAVGGLGLAKPALVRWIFVGWMVAAFPIGWLVSQFLLAVVFFGVLTPLAVFFRLRGRDLLQRRQSRDQASYWTPKQTPPDVRSYLRPY
ncbi:MAG: hypothetical protein HZA90_18575 [Verrucomicrobia bacterium]|nr:hypothetical protein [Verrucomicrobiota bacterium]